MSYEKKNTKVPNRFAPAFTLMELMIAMAIFISVSTLVAGLYVQSFKETKRANLQNQLYEDARFIMALISQEVRDGMIDYDEYYSRYVMEEPDFGQNYGRYFSSFFHPGADGKLGFDCNDGLPRNRKDCVPLRKTIDRHTGKNSFEGKFGAGLTDKEDAFCGTFSYDVLAGMLGDRNGKCLGNDAPDRERESVENELYLISADGARKTILAPERIGTDPAGGPTFALSILRLTGSDENADGMAEIFVCAPEFQCVGGDDCGASTLPRPREEELFPENLLNEACDPAANGFSKDFVPVSPLRVIIRDINFHITPTENPYYAFAESDALIQPRVTIRLTVDVNPEVVTYGEPFVPVTLVSTVSSRLITPVPAPLLIE